MKLQGSVAPVTIAGGGAQSSFSIAMNGKAFRVLSDTLYQNKIGSIVREISCNALDAHVMAKKPDAPFNIHLPDAFEPWFSVQDFGVGLSPDAITEVFTVYFQSTKDATNDTVGAFGLGAKTPFSYTDQFTVTSVYRGVRRVYNAFITEVGVPSIIEMDSAPTSDPNGVEIRLSVKREDYHRFASEVADQLRFFKVKPNILNGSNFNFKAVSNNLVLESANVAISNDGPGYNQPYAHVIQGNVGYPLDIAQISDKIKPENRTLLNTLQGSQVRFYFNIGEIGVTASREAIEYNKHTVASVDKKLDAVRVELVAYINDKMKEIKRDYDKALFLNSSTALNRLARGSGISIPNVKANSSGNYYFDFSAMLLHPTDKNSYGNALTIGTVKQWSPGKTVREVCNAVIQPMQNKVVEIVLRDTNSKPNIRAKHYLSQLGMNATLLEIELTDNDHLTDAFIKKLKETLGGFDKIKRLSAIEPPVVASVAGERQRGAYARPTHYSYVNHSYSNIRQWNREFDTLNEIEDDIAYVVIEDMFLEKSSDESLIRKFNSIVSIDDKHLDLIGIRKSDLKKIEGMKNFIPLNDYMDGVIASLKANRKLYVNYRHAILCDAINTKISGHLLADEILKNFEALAPNAKPTKMLRLAMRLKDKKGKFNMEKVNAVANFLEWDGTKIYERYNKRAESCWKAMLDRFPLLRVYSDWQVRARIKPDHLAKYVSVM